MPEAVVVFFPARTGHMEHFVFTSPLCFGAVYAFNGYSVIQWVVRVIESLCFCIPCAEYYVHIYDILIVNAFCKGHIFRVTVDASEILEQDAGVVCQQQVSAVFIEVGDGSFYSLVKESFFSAEAFAAEACDVFRCVFRRVA